MKLVEVEDIRQVKRDWSRYKAVNRTPVKKYLQEFMDMNVKTVRLDFSEDEYLSPTSCHNSFRSSAHYNKFPIDVKMINGEVYLVRWDLPHARKNHTPL